MDKFFEGLRKLLTGSNLANANIKAGAETVLEAMANKSKEFDQNQKRIEENIKRGSRRSRHRISL